MDDACLAGRVAIVTGSARRIGRLIALRLARAGAAVVVHAKTAADDVQNVVSEIQAGGGKALGCLADVGNEVEVARLIDTAVASFGGIGILVNSAAIRPVQKFSEMTYADWRTVMSAVLDGTYLCCRAAMPHLLASGHGRIVNIGGVSALVGNDAMAHLVAAKAGVMGLTRALAREYGPQGVLVNCLSPGLIEDPADAPEFKSFRRAHVPLDRVPLRRSGQPDEIAKAVLHLCGDDFSYMTGQTIHLNGGFYLT